MLVYILKVAAENTALRECLGAVRARMRLFTRVFSQVNVHVAALGKCAATPVDQALECSLEPVSFCVHYSNGCALVLGKLLEAFLSPNVSAVFLITHFVVVVKGCECSLIIKRCWKSGVVICWVALRGQNRSSNCYLLLIRKISYRALIIRICHFRYDRDNFAHGIRQFVQSFNVRIADEGVPTSI